MKLKIRAVTMNDLESVVKIEATAFQMTETQTSQDMIGRIQNYPDTFLVAEVNDKIVGHVFGPADDQRYIRDELYFQNHPNRVDDAYQMILSLAVAPEYRCQGIATKLMQAMEKVAKQEQRKMLSLTCLPKLFHFYQQLGFQNEGKTSTDIPDPDGISSYNMIKKISY